MTSSLRNTNRPPKRSTRNYYPQTLLRNGFHHERRWTVSSSRRLSGWEQLTSTIPDVVAPMRRYLDQLACILRPGSVSGADQALRSLASGPLGRVEGVDDEGRCACDPVP
jgi:hypothetical protein